MADFECPPSGKLIAARYVNGDYLRVEFREVTEWSEAVDRYKAWAPGIWSQIEFPITAVEIDQMVAGSVLPGRMIGCAVFDCRIGLSWG